MARRRFERSGQIKGKGWHSIGVARRVREAFSPWLMLPVLPRCICMCVWYMNIYIYIDIYTCIYIYIYIYCIIYILYNIILYELYHHIFIYQHLKMPEREREAFHYILDIC